MISNEQRAHEFALSYVKLIVEFKDDFKKYNDNDYSLADIYINQYNEMLTKLKQSI
ncbi:hypothetical protein [Lactococcus hircilactis]|uniref:hypothetical protein n=1 Tax=Lactococcus hircilactis TaxID=1494462 RepID=UPI003FA25A72